MIYTSGVCHLGDVIWFCHVLRRIYGSHKFYCPVEYHWQLREALEFSEGDIELLPLEDAPADAKNTWIACGRFEHAGVIYENNLDMVEYLLRWDRALMVEGGMPPTFNEHKDLLFDFPAIRRNIAVPAFDILVVNSPPLSGQCPNWDQGEMNDLIRGLALRHRVLTTNPVPSNVFPISTVSASICNIGNLSLRAKLVVAVASGAHWCVWNKWRTCPVYYFLSPQFLDYGQEMPHAANVGEMRDLLSKDGWL